MSVNQIDSKENNRVVDKSHFVVYSDGASRGNPGHSAAAYVLYRNNIAIIRNGEYLGITTSTVAEYYGVKIGLQAALDMGAKTVECRIDNLSVVKQLNNINNVKNRDSWPIHESVKELIKKFDSVTFNHVNRENNQVADRLANEILDGYSLAEV